MGMGHSAGFAEVIEISTVKELCPMQYDALHLALAKHGVTFDDFCEAFRDAGDKDELCFRRVDLPTDYDTESAIEEVDLAWQSLQEAFKVNTKVGDSELLLGVEFHDQEGCGDRYDEVSDGFFCVDGCYARTPAAEALGDKIERKFYTVFG